jgi:hypothetical protein
MRRGPARPSSPPPVGCTAWVCAVFEAAGSVDHLGPNKQFAVSLSVKLG